MIILATIVDTGTYKVIGTSGSTVNVICNQEINGRTAQLQVPWNYSNLRLVAYLEEAPTGNFQVVNAATLVDEPDMNTLPSPPASISIVNSAVDDSVFSAPGYIGIPFAGVNVPMVNEYYSLDNGQTWVVIVDSAQVSGFPYSYVGLNLPDTAISKTGKIKIVDVNDPTVFAIEAGTFSIKPQPMIGIVHPANTDTLTADSTFLIQWSKVGVSTVKLEYALAGNSFTKWVPINDKVPGSSYAWSVPDTNSYAEVRISDDNIDGGAPLQISSAFQIRKNFVNNNNGVAAITTLQTGLTITSIAPNPAENGQQLIVRYADENAESISLEMLDLLGHTVVSRTLLSSQSGEASIPTQTLSAGSYIVRMNDGTTTVTKRVEIIR